MSFGLSRGKQFDVGNIGIQMRTLPPSTEGRIDPRNWFEQFEFPFEIEIGSGKGTFLVQEAQNRADVNYLGFEWAAEFYRYAADRIRRNHVQNVRLVHGDATEFLYYWCKDSVADVIHLYFSDPWPKKRHHKRRVIQDSSLVTFYRILKEGGLVHIVTDHNDLWKWCEDHFSRNTSLFTRVEFNPKDSAGDGELVGTNFERKYKREGRPFHATTLVRV
ncbi:MAG: tRNA (guanosine(46)-N7)-methyltransferase TrmB [Phycisphaerales bacterium]|jgi:tRNA (guanine-N7-)-methyltransferase|nr:tRNA (guanosine(46)-N7)-methyltransferase TrmB [Phycisphaerales bacterium]